MITFLMDKYLILFASNIGSFHLELINCPNTIINNAIPRMRYSRAVQVNCQGNDQMQEIRTKGFYPWIFQF